MGSLTWGTKDIPDLSGKVYIVTGGNSGVGYEAARELAAQRPHHHRHTRAGRRGGLAPDAVGGPGAVAKIKIEKDDASVEFMELDLASFKSIHSFVKDFRSKGLPLHCLINNAGLQTPPYAKTADGFEVTLGVNFFGPFFLTQLLLPTLQHSAGAASGQGTRATTRVVWVSAPDESLGDTHWDDLRGAKADSTMPVYGTSKLWDLMAAIEMNDRLKDTGVESFACHPGICRTDLFRKADHDKIASIITDWTQWLAGQTAASGALSLLYCATSPDLDASVRATSRAGKGGTFFGPCCKGPITLNVLNTSARTPGHPDANDPDARRRLYDAAMRIIQEVAEQAVGEPMVFGPQPNIRSAAAGPGAGTEAGGTGLAAAGDLQAALEVARQAAGKQEEGGGVAAGGGGKVATGAGGGGKDEAASAAEAVQEGLAEMTIAGGKKAAEGAQQREEGAAAAPAGVGAS